MKTQKKRTDDLEFSFQVEGVISLHVTVRAKTVDEALEKAQRASVMSLCHKCARSEPGEWCTSGELDCDPVTCSLVDVTVEGDSLGLEGLEDVRKKWGG